MALEDRRGEAQRWMGRQPDVHSRPAVLMPGVGRTRAFPATGRAEVLKLAEFDIRVSHLGQLSSILISSPYSRPLASESLGVGPRHEYFPRLPQMVSTCSPG